MISEATDKLSRSQPPCEAYWRRFDQLDALLRAANFSTSPDRWQNAHDLLLKLLEAGRLPQSPAQLRSLLAPLFCHSAREQQQFTDLFDQWLRLILPPAQQAQPDLPKQPAPQRAAEPPPDKPRLPVLLGLLLALLLTLLVGYYLTWTPDPVKPPPPPPTPPVITNAYKKAPASIKDLLLQPIPPRRPLELPSLDADHRAYIGAGQWLLRLLPLLLGLTWLALLWRGWQMVLARRRGERQQEDPLHAITLAAERDELLDSAPLRTALQRLHTPVAYPTRRLHLDATVQATARHAGLLQPVYAERMAVPECLVLVDYRHGADQMAALARLVSQRLEAAGLSVHRYHYQQDPRRVRAAASAGPARWLALTELAGRYPNARLLLIGEPAPLIDPWRQALRPWAEVLAWWPQRGLLATRMPPLDWMRVFRAEGLAVTDLSSSGLASMAEHLAGLSPQEHPSTAPRVLLPRGLQNSEAWLTPLAPPQSEQQALLKQLRLFLRADGLLLFSAMAAYPQLHWGLTRALDLNLTPDAVARELRLLRIARLPWCREGWLPDWLREALQAQCGKSEQKIIANLYQQLLGLADIDGKGEISLPFDLSQPAATRGLRRWLQRLTQLAPQESSLRDRIFANALLGSRRRGIDFLLPRKLASHLPAGTMRLLLPRLLLLLLLGGLAGWGTGWAWDRWLQHPVAALAQAAQLAEHGHYQVQILHTGETLQLAQALSDTLNQFGFPAPEMRELSTDELTLPDRAEGRVNSVQVGAAEDTATADFLAQRLAYLSWGLKPVVTDQLSDAVPTDHALQQPPKAGELRVWLFTAGRKDSPFSDRSREPLTEAPLQGRRNPLAPSKRENPPQPAVEQEAATEQAAKPQPQSTDQQQSLAEPLPSSQPRQLSVIQDDLKQGDTTQQAEQKVVPEQDTVPESTQNHDTGSIPTDIAKIYNIKPARNQRIDVRYFRKDECPIVDWCRINNTGEYLIANDWLLTGQVSRADLVLMYNQTEYRKVLFWQEEGSKSSFRSNKGICYFITDRGKFLYAHPYTSADPGCEKITSKYALIFPNGTVLFIIDDEVNPDNKKFTRVGVLSSGSKHPVFAQNRKSGKKVTLKEGEFGKFFADGRIEYGEFSLEDFYSEQTLGLGLGPAGKDIAYVRKQEPKIREILEEIRIETLTALQVVGPVIAGGQREHLPMAGQSVPLMVKQSRSPVPTLMQDELSDGTLGPEMVVIPAGSFLMGSPDDEPERSSDEGPQHQVKIDSFAIGRTEVTFEQYDLFAQATGRKLPNDQGWGRDSRPVINISWEDATTYATWLSEQTGQRYRLPSEAEWEYAARTGTLTPFSTGDCIHTDQANYNGNYDYADCGAKTGLSRAKTVPAGSLPANPWGLHEVHGNVWEWVQDCWHPNYGGAPQDGTAWEAGGDCALRLGRGGGWFYRPENLRSAFRFRLTADDAFSYLGFRLARTL